MVGHGGEGFKGGVEHDKGKEILGIHVMPRLIVVDPSLRQLWGHHFNYNKCLVDEAKRRDMEFLVLGHAQIQVPQMSEQLQALKVFDISPEDALEEGRTALEAAILANNYFFQRIGLVMDKVLGEGDFVFFHSFNARMARAIADWTLLVHRKLDIRIGILLMYPDYLEDDRVTPSAETFIYRYFLEAMAQVDRDRVWIGAEHGEIARDFQALSGNRVPIDVGPHIKPEALLDFHRRRLEATPAGDKIRIGYFGTTQLKRGAHLVPKIVEGLEKRFPGRLEFLLNFNLLDVKTRMVEMPDLLDELAALEKRPNVTVARDHLPTEKYYTWLANTDIILLPYSEWYNKSGSGQLFEGLALGKLMVAPEASCLAREIARVGSVGVTFPEQTAEAVVAATANAVERFAELAPRAREAGFRWQDENRPSAFFDRWVRGQLGPCWTA